MEKTNKIFIIVGVTIAILLVAGAIISTQQGVLGKNISSKQAGEKAIEYINKNILADSGETATLVKVTDKGTIYEVKINVGGKEFDSYISKDGKFVFPVGYDTTANPSPSPTPSPSPSPTQYSAGALENLAKCLTQKGMKFYGAYDCGWCKKQKELFGEAAKFLPYIECVDEKTEEMTAKCKNAGITGFPTWETPDKKRESGFQSPEKLAELSGCSF